MNDQLIIGTRYNYASETEVGLQTADRRHHVYVIGQTGSGKTTLIRNLIVQHILAGDGVGVIDPHGDLVDRDLLDLIPPWRTDDLIYFNPTDFEYPVGLNVLAKTTHEPSLIASGLVTAFKSIWSDSWGPRLEYILRNALASLLECENTTLLSVLKLLTSSEYRNWVVRQLRNPALIAFWTQEYEEYNARYRQEAIAPIQNKIGLFATSPLTRNILGQVKNKIDFSSVMNDRRIFLANLSKGQIGDDQSNLLGALLVARFRLAAMRRATLPEEDRRDFFLFVDEFQNFCTDSFASILSEARKFRLNITLSHQYTEQLPLPIRQAVFGNVGTLICFRIGYTDAEIMEKQFGRTFVASEFTDLNRFEILAKSLVDGDTTTPFRARTLPPFGRIYGRRENLIRCSREKYSLPRGEVEKRIGRWMNRFV